MKPSSQARPAPAPPRSPPLPQWFLLFAGVVFALILVKQGNPAIFAKMIPRPANVSELVFQFWPVQWGYRLLLLLGLATVLMWLRSGLRPRWSFPSPWAGRCFALAGLWLGWQFVAANDSVQAELTALTVAHFVGCVACFAFGLFVLRDLRPVHAGCFWLPILAGFGYSLWTGWDQHFGGLETIRKQVMSDAAGGTNSFFPLVSLEALQKRAASNRIYGTFVYPNTFAGAILLLLPVALAWIHETGRSWRTPLRWALQGMVAGLAAVCLYWSGSKSAWLIAVVLAVIAVWLGRASRRWKIAVTAAVLVFGLVAFGVRYAGYFRRGAPSVEARFDYWKAAVQIAGNHPWNGTGPGTFQVPYQRIKAPESEMARLAHNDYLEQASDAGWIGFFLYGGLIAATAIGLYRQRSDEWLPLAVLLGWTGVQLQSFSEFNLYIPGLAWLSFVFAGWLLARNRVDSRSAVA